MEWEAVVAAKNLVDDMVTFEAAPGSRKLYYNAAITEMNNIAATLDGAFDAVTMTKVHIGINQKVKDEGNMRCSRIVRFAAALVYFVQSPYTDGIVCMRHSFSGMC